MVMTASAKRAIQIAGWVWLAGAAAASEPAATAPPCRIEVVEQGSGWPVPLVELRSVHNVRLVTDNAGVIALDAPELMGREVWFTVNGNGYEASQDGFGLRGVRLVPERGKTLRVELARTIIARRLGRITGAGIFAESQRLGGEADWEESGVAGCDSVQNAVYRGRMFWLWGDTSLLRYPLGIFHATSATTPVRPLEVFEPPIRLKYQYFAGARGAPRGVAEMPGDGPTWVTGYASLPDQTGRERLVGLYAKIKPPLEAYRYGLCVWNDRAGKFEHLKDVWTKTEETAEPPPMPKGHPAIWDDANGTRWVLFGDPLPALRCPATFEAWQDPTAWEVLRRQDSLRSAADSSPVKPHSGSIAFSGWRKRWVAVFMQWFGKPSALGELWYAEADQPTGPWGPAVKIVSHENYTFYNPRIHPEFTDPESPILLFEGTYTMQFADRPHPVPRYDYNQVLYRLDLDGAALAPARE
ncbi:MAG: hypothetical protein PHN77_06760 [Thermoguttaceae bacterium]|jgi:hypothetical protein|nr:hypothetical protein [Thermoguttaceae bacterium]